MLNYRNYIKYGYTDFFNRASCIEGFSKHELDYLKQHHISTIIDLRQHHLNHRDYDFDIDTYFTYFNFGLVIRLFSSVEDQRILINEYMNIVEQYTAIRCILKTIANASEKVLVYCSWGKDRTGIIACLVLMIAGVPKDKIVEDYSMSEGQIYSYICSNHDSRIPDSFLHAYSSYMEQFIDTFEIKYQDISMYCNKIGFNKRDIDLIRRKFSNENV